MPSQYLPLYEYVKNRYANVVVLTFAQIEDLIGFKLPDVARTQREWWTSSGTATDAEPNSDAWMQTGRVVTPNLLARTVRFVRP